MGKSFIISEKSNPIEAGDAIIRKIHETYKALKNKENEKIEDLNAMLANAKGSVFDLAELILKAQVALKEADMINKENKYPNGFLFSLEDFPSIITVPMKSGRESYANVFQFSPKGENMEVRIYPKEQRFLFFQKDEEGYIDECDSGMDCNELIEAVKTKKEPITALNQPMRLIESLIKIFPTFFKEYMEACDAMLERLLKE